MKAVQSCYFFFVTLVTYLLLGYAPAFSLDLPLHGPEGETILGLGNLYDAAFSSDETLHIPRLPSGEQIIGVNILDFKITPDGQDLLFLTPSMLYQLHLENGIMESLILVNGREMEWLLEGQYLAFFSPNNYESPLKKAKGIILEWPSLSVVRNDLHQFMISLDHNSILYQPEDSEAYTLWDLATGREETVLVPPTLKIVDIHPQERIVSLIQGEWQPSQYGQEIKPVYYNQWNYVSLATIQSVTLEEFFYEDSYYSTHSMQLFDQIKDQELLFGVQRMTWFRDYQNNTYIPFLWEQSTGQSQKSFFQGYEKSICPGGLVTYQVSPHGNWLATPAQYCDNLVLLNMKARLQGDQSKDLGPFPRGRVAFSPDDAKAATIFFPEFECRRYGNKQLLTLVDLNRRESSNSIYFRKDSPSFAAFSPDQETLVLGGKPCRMDVIRFNELVEELVDLTASKLGHNWQSVSFSPDGQRLLVSHDQDLTLWDTQAWKAIADLTIPQAVPHFTSYAPAGDVFLVALLKNGHIILVRDSQTYEIIATLSGHSEIINQADFSPDGQRILSASHDKTVKVWNWREEKEILAFTGHGAAVVFVQYLPDGIHAVSVDSNRVAQVWNTETGEIVQTLSDVKLPVALAPEGDLLFCGTQVWDLKTYQKIKLLDEQEMDLTCVAVSPNGEHLLTAAPDSLTKIWSIPEQIRPESGVQDYKIFK